MEEKVLKYLKELNKTLESDLTFQEVYQQIQKSDTSFKVIQRAFKRHFDLDWIDEIEECLVALDTIVRNPRKFIVVEEDIIDISLAKQISKESVKHLATHTNLISAVDGDKVIPSKILNTSKEESYEIYENRFIYTLLVKLNEFVTKRYEMVKEAVINNDQTELIIEGKYEVNKTELLFNLNTIANMSVDEALDLDQAEELNVYERVARINSIVSGFMKSPFARELRNCSPVRPPITRTNVIKKDPNFKQAVKLWDFLWSYNKKGFDMEPINKEKVLSAEGVEVYQGLMALNHLVLEALFANENVHNEINNEKHFNKEYIFKNIPLARDLNVYSLDILFIKFETKLKQYAHDKKIKLEEHKKTLKTEKSLKVLAIFEEIELEKDYNNFVNEFESKFKKTYESLSEEERLNLPLEVLKDEYNYRFVKFLDKTFKGLKKIIEVL